MKTSLIVIFVGIACTAVGDQFDILSSRFSGTSQSLHGVAFGNGAYVAVGDNGTILYSTDTVTWIPRLSNITNRLNGVKYGMNGFVTVGDASTILTSTNGFTWIQCASPVSNKLSAVTYGMGRYVAVGSSGIVVTSTNGMSWNSINTGAPYNFNGVGFEQINNSETFILVGDSGTIMTSIDGLAWTLRFSGTFSRLNAVSLTHSPSWNSFLMVAVGDSGTLETSSDGVNWAVVNSGTSANLLAIANDELHNSSLPTFNIPPRFGAIGQGGVFLSGSGGTWISRMSGTATNLNGLLYAGGNFLVVGDSGVIEAAIPWLPRDSGTSQSLGSIVFYNGSFFAAGSSGTGPGDSSSIILQSTNGRDWATVYSGTEYGLGNITYGTNGYLADDYFGTVLSSSNGLNWSSHTISAPDTIFSGSIAYGNGVYVAVGSATVNDTPVAYRSSDGLSSWNGPYVLNHAINSITFANNIFVAVGNGAIDISSDGITWTTCASPGVALSTAGFWNGLFVGIGDGGVVMSRDGTNWTSVSYTRGSSITFGDQGFIAFYPNLALTDFSTSPDGTNWTVRGFDGPTGSVAFGNNTYIVVGNGISQTVPTNSQATPLLNGQMVVQGFKLSAIAQPTYTYHIQSSTNLADTNWLNAFTFTSAQAVTSFIDTDATNSPLRFYKITTP